MYHLGLYLIMELPIRFREANMEPSMPFRKANTKRSMQFRRNYMIFLSCKNARQDSSLICQPVKPSQTSSHKKFGCEKIGLVYVLPYHTVTLQINDLQFLYHLINSTL